MYPKVISTINHVQRPVEFVIFDSFGEQLLESYSEISASVFLNTTLVICATTLAKFDLDFLQKYLLRHDCFQLLLMIHWTNKIYIYPQYSPTISGCPRCLCLAIKNNLDLHGPSYQALTGSQTRIEALVFPANTITNALLFAFTILDPEYRADNNEAVVYIYSISDGSCTREPIFIAPNCDICNEFEQKKTCELDLSSLHKAAISPTRYAPISDFEDSVKDFCGQHLGMIQDIADDLQLPIPSSSAQLLIRGQKREPTLGRSTHYQNARTIAILEALERLSGLYGSAHFVRKTATFLEMPENTIYPENYCMHSDSQYGLPLFPFVKFRENLLLNWVKGIELFTQQARWVPESMVFYGSNYVKNKQMMAFESSNGCSIGASYAEAALNGLLEVVERDSFLLAWYLKKELPNITNMILQDDTVRAIYHKIQYYCDIEIRFYDSTAEYAIPSVIAVALCQEKDMPCFAIASAAGIRYRDAAQSALYELICHYIRLRYLIVQPGVRENAILMANNFSLVKKMEDHGLMHAIPESMLYHEFLLHDNQASLAIHNEILDTHTPEHTLMRLVEKLQKTDREIIAIDQTPLFLRHKNLYCVKTIISDMLPITFGHHYARINTKRSRMSIDYKEACPHPFP